MKLGNEGFFRARLSSFFRIYASYHRFETVKMIK